METQIDQILLSNKMAINGLKKKDILNNIQEQVRKYIDSKPNTANFSKPRSLAKDSAKNSYMQDRDSKYIRPLASAPSDKWDHMASKSGSKYHLQKQQRKTGDFGYGVIDTEIPVFDPSD